MRFSLPRAGWLALGAIVAALLFGGPLALPIAPLPAALVALACVGAGISLALLRRPAGAALLLAAGTVGTRAALAALIAGSAAGLAPLPVGSADWTAAVVDVSSPTETDQRAFVRLHDSGGGDGWLVYAWLPRHPALVPGDEIAVRGTVDLPPADAEGFAGFLESRGAAGTLKAHTLELVGSGGGFTAAVEHLRWGIDEALSRAIPEPEAGLASGILVGLRERVSRSVADDFTVTGLTHVVAISGWNIALVAGIATALLRATGLGRRPRSGIVVAAIVAYTIVAGAEASVIRAAVMGGVVIIARESGRPSGAAAALGLACWGLLLVEPAMIGDIGLQLSLAATAGLLVLGGRAEAAVRRVTRGRSPRWFDETLGVSLAAQLSTLPLILFHFGRLSLISPLANLLVAPVVPLAMLGAAVGTITGPLTALPFAGTLLAPILLAAWLPLAAMTRGAQLLAGIPFANLELLPPLDLVAAGLALAALVLALRRVRRSLGIPARLAPTPPSQGGSRSRKLAATGASAVLVATISIVLVAAPAPLLRISVLEVGQGDAILLEARNGDRILVDGGSDPDLLVRRLDERIPVWDRHIDLAVVTHPHEDHAGGLAGLVPRYSVRRLAETGMASDGAGMRELRATARERGIARIRLTQGHSLALGEARVDVVWPPAEAIPEVSPSSGRRVNDTSIVLAIELGRQRALLTGDLEDDRDEDLLAALATLPHDDRRWDLLKVAHHGSATASSRSLLESLRPRIAAISVGTDNPYGHPALSTLGRLSAVGAAVWRTDQRGTLSIAFDGQSRTATALLADPPPTSPCPTAPAVDPSRTADGRDACYIRPDGGTHPNRSTLTPHVHLALATAAPAHDRGGGSGRLPGLPGHAGRSRRRSAPGRDCRAPP